jgi:hypothetical protein
VTAPGQLTFDLEAALAPALAGRLRDKRRIPFDSGAARLLAELVRAGLAEDSLVSAAGLCLALEEQAAGRQEVSA